MNLPSQWAFVAGAVIFGGLGVLLGRWMTWLTLDNPIRQLVSAYRDLFRDIRRLLLTGRWT